MRLSKIKLAGFKSFVDPVTIDLTSNLTGIVGPNGCGKSNTIDAVRWVMGESSAKHLRGGSMEDVIFNGSSDRKPVGQASVELVFDNSDASLGGEYAKYAEIGVKRQVSRDGQSKYFLNGSKCRRKDITDIFLGTGLGPRSYAIIEQGMVSRLIEAKPEELRVYIEEAAGISKYRQRRRETENRIRHTRENLDRLSDLREEIDKHLKQLKRQASAAERFKSYKKEERLLTAELLVLRLNEVQDKVKTHEIDIAKQGVLQQQKISTVRESESFIEKKRLKHNEAYDQQNTHQAEYYKIGAEISRIEQTLQHQKETQHRFRQQQENLSTDIAVAQRHLQEDGEKRTTVEIELEEKQQQRLELEGLLESYKETYDDATEALKNWQTDWQTMQNAIAEPTQTAQVERARMEQIEQRLQHSKSRLEKNKSEFELRANNDLTTQYDAELEAQQLAQAQQEEHKLQLQTHQGTLDTLHEELQQRDKTINQWQSELRNNQGRLASLEVLRKASSGQDNKQLNHWLSQHQLDDALRLSDQLMIEPGWELALETVLDKQLSAISLNSIDHANHLFTDLPKHDLTFVEEATSSPNSSSSVGTTLLSKISRGKAFVSYLDGIYCADSFQDALQHKNTLAPHESIICKDGFWLGANWLHIKSLQADQQSVFARNTEIEQLVESIAEQTSNLQTMQDEQAAARAQSKEMRQSLSQLQQVNNESHRSLTLHESKLRSLQDRMEQLESGQTRMLAEQEELAIDIEELQQEHLEATEKRNAAVTALEQMDVDKQQLAEQQHALELAVEQHLTQYRNQQNLDQQLSIQIESLKTNVHHHAEQLERTTVHLENLQESLLQLETEQTSTQVADDNDLQEQLKTYLTERHQAEEKLQQARMLTETLDEDIRKLNEQRLQGEQALEQVRSVLEGMKLKWQESCVRETTLKEQLAETDCTQEDIQKDLPESAKINTHQQQLEQVISKVQRLGAINLAAIEEFKQEAERKDYLDQQNTDLTEALETLESAIAKIDKDTRSLFKDTFEKVNTKVQEMFPRLFGGGKAYLELTDTDLLKTGVMIMARPPGKRITNIHLMSGGEKALTAVAMVFAIFELNPAPFCMLDEVDAPLDEANVGRFCELVRHMSSRIQFIFITHNKTTMELAENLMGVTMREMGVSKTVSVNVSDAAELVKQ
ncbi:MAG: Chromosome partition protein smc [uncultured Thiotrichaceae bacterium]|uniref:Chromosome partition protein Smc n=1 Tax=uncultured Thiotrichaceae bacterium TaxID=298394 RepID=A0A6S6TVZ1_9GAMM|nr:MAG: Chromosome partition protein smc [uncultured Thiotrichaceae bacterium]